MEVFSGEMSSSDYRLRQFSNYSVNHQSCGLMWAILWSDGQCNHHWRSPPPSVHLCLFHPSLRQSSLFPEPPARRRAPRLRIQDHYLRPLSGVSLCEKLFHPESKKEKKTPNHHRAAKIRQRVVGTRKIWPKRCHVLRLVPPDSDARCASPQGACRTSRNI